MCSPQLFIMAASQGMKMVAARRENRAAQAQAIEQNRIAKLSGYLELKKASFNSFVDWVLDLRDKIKIPHKISDSAKLTNDDIEKLSPMALNGFRLRSTLLI